MKRYLYYILIIISLITVNYSYRQRKSFEATCFKLI